MPETIFDDSGLEFVIEDKGTNTYSGYLILTRENPIAVTFLPFKTQKETWDMYVRLIKSPEPKDVVRLCCDGVDDRRSDLLSQIYMSVFLKASSRMQDPYSMLGWLRAVSEGCSVLFSNKEFVQVFVGC
ncbi:hypothetical protein V6N13_110370 [Hibiscus sabdariffa]